MGQKYVHGQKHDNSLSSSKIFIVFFQIGMLTFGGGLVMISVIRRELLYHLQWVTKKQFSDDLSVSTSLPGPFIVNLAFIEGYRFNGVKGVVASVSGVVLPSFLVVVVISYFLCKHIDNTNVHAFFKGAQIAVVGVLAHSMFLMIGDTLTTINRVTVALLALTIIVILKIHPVWAILTSIIASPLLIPDLISKDDNDDF